VGALQILLDKGKDADWFASPLIVALAVIAAVGFVAFLIWELTERYPIVDLTLFKMRDFNVGTAINSLGYCLFFGNIVLLPLWLQTQLGFTATWAGVVSTPSGVVAIVMAPLIGRVLAKVDARLVASFSLIAFALSYVMRAHLTTTASLWDFMIPMAVQGAAMGTFFISSITITLNRVPPERVPSVSGVSTFMRITAGSFAASIVTTFWDRHAAFHQSRLVERATAYDEPLREATRGLSALGLGPTQALGVLDRAADVQAYAKSAMDFFWISGWMSVALVGVVWFAHSTLGRRPSVHVAAD